MKALIQRVKRASVAIEGELFSAINSGILVFLGVEKGDEKENAEKLAQKIVNLRIFEDENEKMNISALDLGLPILAVSLKDVNGEMLVVSQFTLCGDCKKGTRPSFDKAANPDLAVDLYEYFIKCIEDNNIPVKTGKFRAMMDVELINDGPVTFWVEK